LVKFSALYADLHGAANITVIALPNEVFHQMVPSEYTELINSNRLTIRSILTHHILANLYKTSGLLHGARIQTMSGSDVIIYHQEGILRINNSLVTKPDICLANGIVHIVDSMLQKTQTIQGKDMAWH